MKYEIQIVRYEAMHDPDPEVLKVAEAESRSLAKVEREAQSLFETMTRANGWRIAAPDGNYASAWRTTLA